MMLNHLWLGLAFLPLVACSAEANVPRIIVSQIGVEIRGVPNPNGVITTTRTRFDHPVGFEVPKVLDASLFPRSARAVSSNEQADLSFVEEFTLLLASRSDENLRSEQIAHYQRSPEQSGEMLLLEIPTNNQFNVVEYWASGDAYYELVVRGQLPESNWVLDVVAEFEGNLAL